MSDIDRAIGDLDNYICEMDEHKVGRGEPLVSVLITNSDGSVIGAFWKTIQKYPHLRRSGEPDHQLISRLHAEAFAFEKGTLH